MKPSKAMIRLLSGMVMVLFFLTSPAQQAFKLHVQPGKVEMRGDGDDYTTILVTARDKVGALVSDASNKLSTSTIDVVKKLDALPSNPKLGEFEQTGKKNTKWMLIGGGGLLIILLVISGILLFKKRKKSRLKVKGHIVYQHESKIPDPVILPSLQSSQPSQLSQPATQPIQRFCVECGNPLKAGARFCTKCGKQLYHI